MSDPLQASGARALTGIAFLVTATACFAVLDTTVKYVGAFIPVLVAVWFRYMFQAVLVSAVMLPLRGRSLLRTDHPRFQLLRGCLLLLVSVLSFLSVQYMPVGEFTAIVMISPLVVTLLAALFLHERVTPMRWVLVVGGFAGALMVVQPGGGVVGWASLLPLVWQAIPDARTFWLLCLVGLMGSIGHFLLILAFARTPAATLTPFLYAQIGFAMLCGWAVFGHVPGPLELAGIGLIVLCGATASVLASRAKQPVEPPEP